MFTILEIAATGIWDKSQRSFNVQVSDVKNVIIWGNHSSTTYPDVTHATVGDKPVPELIKDDEWVGGIDRKNYLSGSKGKNQKKKGKAVAVDNNKSTNNLTNSRRRENIASTTFLNGCSILSKELTDLEENASNIGEEHLNLWRGEKQMKQDHWIIQQDNERINAVNDAATTLHTNTSRCPTNTSSLINRKMIATKDSLTSIGDSGTNEDNVFLVYLALHSVDVPELGKGFQSAFPWFQEIIEWKRPVTTIMVMSISLLVKRRSRKANQVEVGKRTKFTVTTPDQTTIDSIVAAQHGINTIYNIMQLVNILLLKIWTIWLANAPKIAIENGYTKLVLGSCTSRIACHVLAATVKNL
ncbi:hypothetical protein Tco_0722567 [Tanacetum coccineum]